jgi:23S rRNA pseudouridine2605 synthase
MIRINRFLASCGVASRRAAEKYITDGRVLVNGHTITELGTQIDETRDVVLVDGRVIRLERKKVYIVLNKPKGYVTTLADEKGRKTVLDLVSVHERVVPVGRLDYQSEGLLLLTNDGEMMNRLLHPRYGLQKTYYATLKTAFDPAHFSPLTAGVELEEFTTAPCEAWFYGDTTDRIAIRIHEGKKHQIRRMLAHLGYEVKNLRRVCFGPLELGKLRVGQWRYLEPDELRALKKATVVKR